MTCAKALHYIEMFYKIKYTKVFNTYSYFNF